jgi:acetylornithine deacetylase/succinyl-diaminopimelate desuccinylase-like protein
MQEQIVAILRELVAINSINATLSGGPGEMEIAAFIKNRLSWFGLEANVRTSSRLSRGRHPARRCC